MNHWISGCLLAALLSTPALARDAAPVNEDHDRPDEKTVAEPGDAPLMLAPIVVTTALMQDPYTVTRDPRRPLLPLPAHDGASYLESIPGFTQSRKGGTSGDPLFRGLGGSRLNILVDEAIVLGGCDGRMDPPTAYIFPETFDRIEVLKGPQSVRHGVSQAGVVRFERESPEFDTPAMQGYFSSTAGSFERGDLVGEFIAGGTGGYARLTGSWSAQDDYDDGNGNRVHSRYERWNAGTTLGWTPDDATRIELILDRSGAEAAYDDRMMDGVVFDRTGYTLRAVRRDLAPWLHELKAVLYYSHIDHVMDNFTLRQPPMMRALRYPDRRTRGGRLTAEMRPGSRLAFSAGLDWMDNRHRDNILRGPATAAYRDLPRQEDAEFADWGAWVEIGRDVTPRGHLMFGLRNDVSRAEALAGKNFGGAPPGYTTRSSQISGFVRYRHDLERLPLELHIGLGRAERAPDYWERRRRFDLASEVLTQVDLGARLRTRRLTATVALFHGRFDDYILINAPGIAPVEAQNIDATTRGGEFDLRYRLGHRLSLTASAAWVRSTNDDAGLPLAQTPPAEATLGIDYDGARWSGGVLLRGVARQDRIHPGHGTIYSLDTSPTQGYETAAVYAGYRLGQHWTLVGGLDNLFDRYYETHIQRGSADLGASALRIAEPGRRAWLRLSGRW